MIASMPATRYLPVDLGAKKRFQIARGAARLLQLCPLRWDHRWLELVQVGRTVSPMAL